MAMFSAVCRNTWKAFDVNAFEDGLEAALNAEQMNYARAMVTGPRRGERRCALHELPDL